MPDEYSSAEPVVDATPDDGEEFPAVTFLYKEKVELNGSTLDDVLVDEIEAQCRWALEDAEQLLRKHRTSYKDFLRLPRTKRDDRLRQLREEVLDRVDVAMSLSVDYLRLKLRQEDATEEDDGITHAEYFSDLAPIAIQAKSILSSLANSLRKLTLDE